MADNMIADQRWPTKVPSTQRRISLNLEFSDAVSPNYCRFNFGSHSSHFVISGVAGIQDD